MKSLNGFAALIMGVLIVSSAWASGNVDVDEYLTDDMRARLEGGETVIIRQVHVAEDSSGGLVLTLVQASSEEIWSSLVDFESKPQYLTDLVSVEQYLDEGDRRGLRTRRRAGVRGVTNHVVEFLDAETLTLSWRLDHSHRNSAHRFSGFWKLIPHGDGATIVAYYAEKRHGRPIPRFVRHRIIMKDLARDVFDLKSYFDPLGVPEDETE